MRVGILVSGGGFVLQSILDSRLFGDLDGCELGMVVSSQPGAYALFRAEMAGLPTAVEAAESHPNRQSHLQAVADRLLRDKCDTVVLAGFEPRLTAAFLDTFRGRILNVKDSLLPLFGELDTLAAQAEALRLGMRLTGATSCFVENEDGTGPIIDQRTVPVLAGDTPEALSDRITRQVGADLLAEALTAFVAGKLTVENGRVYRAE